MFPPVSMWLHTKIADCLFYCSHRACSFFKDILKFYIVLDPDRLGILVLYALVSLPKYGSCPSQAATT